MSLPGDADRPASVPATLGDGRPVRWVPSPNHDRRTVARPDMIVLHYTDMASADAAVARLCDPEARVSAHYLIGADGSVVQMVEETRRAWHAGVSAWGSPATTREAAAGPKVAEVREVAPGSVAAAMGEVKEAEAAPGVVATAGPGSAAAPGTVAGAGAAEETVAVTVSDATARPEAVAGPEAAAERESAARTEAAERSGAAARVMAAAVPEAVRHDINSRSIGIELDSPGHRPTAPHFPEAQIAALLALLADLRGRWPVAPWNVVAHSDIAPTRKIDPGEAFPWARLATAGHVLATPEPTPPNATAPLTDEAYGRLLRALAASLYVIDDPAAAGPVVDAFHRRHLPPLVGHPATALTLATAEALAATVEAAAVPAQREAETRRRR